ncbi:glyoxylase I 4 [Cornus florida]|uniref:glyoxylase I 4 n=1 Tax=Cornus florida TaxID=4283 RepID=UPI0028A10A41|nr:glyoxylase I 4 [Cornus florida]
MEKKDERNKGNHAENDQQLPLMALNHISRLCRCVKESVDFYTKVLGFVLIKRPKAFHFDGAWLFNYGVGIHLVHSEDEERLAHSDDLDPMDNHISFQCEDIEAVEQKLKELKIKYMKRTVEDENGTALDQLFFKDPDGFMIEICNCENLKLVPAASFGNIKLPPIELEAMIFAN